MSSRPPAAENAPPTPLAEPDQPLHQRPRCRTVCDEAYGEPAQGIAPGTPSEEIADYQCPTCEAPTTEFVAVRTPLFSIIN